MKKRLRRIDKTLLAMPSLLFKAWLDAALEWRRLQSDPAEARCMAARTAYYQAAWGYVPPVRAEGGDT